MIFFYQGRVFQFCSNRPIQNAAAKKKIRIINSHKDVLILFCRSFQTHAVHLYNGLIKTAVS